MAIQNKYVPDGTLNRMALKDSTTFKLDKVLNSFFDNFMEAPIRK